MAVLRYQRLRVPSDLDHHAVQCFARACQLAAGALLEPSDAVDVFTQLHTALGACPDNLCTLRLTMLAWVLVGLARRFFSWHPRVRLTSGEVAASHRRVAQALFHVVDLHTSPSLRLRDIARRVGVGPAYLSDVMNRQSGRPYVAHLQAIRILRAAVLLSDGHHTIKAVACRCGYRHSSHLNRHFRATFHTTPTQFRRLLGAKTVERMDFGRSSRLEASDKHSVYCAPRTS
jgi:AraC-like DNA-binding protein